MGEFYVMKDVEIIADTEDSDFLRILENIEAFEEGDLLGLTAINELIRKLSENNVDNLVGKISEIIMPCFQGLGVIDSQKTFLNEVKRVLNSAKKIK